MWEYTSDHEDPWNGINTSLWSGDYSGSHSLILAGWHREAHSTNREPQEGTSGYSLDPCHHSLTPPGAEIWRDAHLSGSLSFWWCWGTALVSSSLLSLIQGSSSSMDTAPAASHSLWAASRRRSFLRNSTAHLCNPSVGNGPITCMPPWKSQRQGTREMKLITYLKWEAEKPRKKTLVRLESMLLSTQRAHAFKALVYASVTSSFL